MMMGWRLVPLAVLLLAGCAGKPTTYLTLSSQTSPRTTIAPGAPVAVAQVGMPPSLDRLFLTTEFGDNQLHVANHTRWAAPLDGMMQAALARDLATRLSETTVLMPGDDAPQAGTRLVRVNVQSFIADQTGLVTLDADWSIMSARHHITAQDRAHILVAGPHGAVMEARSMSIAVARLADQIATRF